MARSFLATTLVVLFLLSAVLSFGYAFFTELAPHWGSRLFFSETASLVGVSVGVPPNPTNTLAEELKNKELSLAEREKALSQKEALFSSATQTERQKDETYLYLFVTNGTLLFLIMIHLYFDHERRRRLIASPNQ